MTAVHRTVTAILTDLSTRSHGGHQIKLVGAKFKKNQTKTRQFFMLNTEHNYGIPTQRILRVQEARKVQGRLVHKRGPLGITN